MPTALRWRGYRFFFWSGDRDEPPHTRVKRVLDFGESLKRSVRSRIRTIIEDLLKLQNSPPQEPRGGWYDTVLAQRSDLLDEADGEHPARSRARVAGPVRRGTTECCHVFAQARRECGRRRPARHLPLHVRPDHRRRAAVSANVADGRAMAGFIPGLTPGQGRLPSPPARSGRLSNRRPQCIHRFRSAMDRMVGSARGEQRAFERPAHSIARSRSRSEDEGRPDAHAL
jgi:Domain of unknown function DUF29